MDTNLLTDALKAAIDASIERAKQPIVVTKNRNGWAGYQAGRRVTKFYFSEQGAQRDIDDQLSSDVMVQIVEGGQ